MALTRRQFALLKQAVEQGELVTLDIANATRLARLGYVSLHLDIASGGRRITPTSAGRHLAAHQPTPPHTTGNDTT